MDVKKDVIKCIRAQKPAKEMTKKLKNALQAKFKNLVKSDNAE